MDTALGACSAAVWSAKGLRARSFETMARGQAERLVPMIGETMAAAGLGFEALDAFAVTVGPGTFTGIRIGLAAARALALARAVPLIGRTTLEVIAAGALSDADGRRVLVVVDAHRGQVYAQLFAPDGQPLDAPRARDPATLVETLPEGALLVTGTGVGRLVTLGALEGDRICVHAAPGLPDAADLARLAAAAPTLPAPGEVPEPLYLRPPDAKPAAG